MIVKIKCYNKAKPYFLINSASALEYGLHRANVATRELAMSGLLSGLIAKADVRKYKKNAHTQEQRATFYKK